ncbi:MAG TPA: hypothetical protein VKT27_00800 [Candidatus Binataceae bacterium]|nr:hypothetical protein [Candidatus Binataceae bacterium]
MRKTFIAGIVGLVAAGTMLLSAGAGRAIADAATKAVTGTLEDSFCYNVVGAKGAGHAQCALKCARKGIPVALVEKGTEKTYVLLPPKNDEPLPEDVLKNMEKEVTVTGKSYSKGGVEFLTVESVK